MIILRVDCYPSSKVKVISRGVLDILAKLQFEMARRDDICARREFILDDQSSFIGFGYGSLYSIKVFYNGFVRCADSELHSRLLLDREGAGDGAIEGS